MATVPQAVRNLVRSAAMRALLTWERIESGVSYNPVSAENAADPYFNYKKIRLKDPVHRMRLLDAWLLTRYEDVDTVLRDYKRFSNAERSLNAAGRVTLLDLDPPDHTRLRSLVSRAFTPRSVTVLESRVRDIAEEMLDAVEEHQ